jgi:hypothetical protein
MGELLHYGILRRSGRYPWGSGGTQNKRNRDFLDYIANLKAQGLSDTEIAKGIGQEGIGKGKPISRDAFQAARAIAKNQQKASTMAQAQRLRDRGWSNVAIGERMGLNESSVRALLAPGEKDKLEVLHVVSNQLRDAMDQYRFVQIGSGVELHMGVSENKLKAAVALLKEEGYVEHTVQVDQLGTAPGNKTSVKVLAPPGTKYKDVAANTDQIGIVNGWSEDGGRSFFGIKPPLSISSKRIGVRYKEDGGDSADGVIYVRRGVKDVSLDKSNYAQVRVMVDGTHYLKGMAMYKDDLPEGVDLLFNTNKSNTGNKLDAMKSLKDDPDNPFGAAFRRQIVDEHGNVTSSMNIINEEGNWDTYSRNLSSQFLSKQSPTLIKQQLDKEYADRKANLDEIMALTNPTVRQKLLESFADGADASAVDLKAAALPRQASHVILPVESMKETEIYAPTFLPGERVVLIRYPHGGTFEIPELTVNNRQREAKRLLGNAPDAVGIHPNVAKKLSGADFDGDFVVVIPQGAGAKVKISPSLEGLKDFDPQHSYPPFDGMKTIDGGVYHAATKTVDYGTKPDGTPKKSSPRGKGLEMGKISNLITDMTLKGASPSGDEIAAAVRHSMVVIDAEKHHLNYKLSYDVNGIRKLEEKYQAKPDGRVGGASTLLSKRKQEMRVPKRVLRPAKQGGPVDPDTGKKVYIPNPKAKPYIDPKTGREVIPKMPVRSLSLVEDAHTLSSGTPREALYADHSNRMKELANIARLTAVNTHGLPQSPSAKATYKDEVKSLNAKLELAIRNRPLERQAQILANALISQKLRDNNDFDPAQVKRMKFQALDEYRRRTGAGKDLINITDREWEAVQAGAVSKSRLREILDNADQERVKKLATPKQTLLMTPTKTSQAHNMLANGYTQAEVAQALGVSLTTLKNTLNGGGS